MPRERRLIVTIGIDRYRKPEWALSNAVSDATESASAFAARGYEPVYPPILDAEATHDRLQRLVSDDLTVLQDTDSLIIFFAGHGRALDHKPAGKTVTVGYLIPMDATEKVSTWIDLDAWLRRISLLPALHILVIVDACHSGIALHPRMRSRDVDMRQHGSFAYLRSRSSRHVLTSARAEQVAADGGPNDHHSLFTTCLLEALDTLPGVGAQRLVTGSVLALHVRDRVSSFANQIPDFGKFGSDERGDLVLELGAPPQASAAAQRRVVVVAIAAWLRFGHLLIRRMLDAVARTRIPLLAIVGVGVFAVLWYGLRSPSRITQGRVTLFDGAQKPNASVFEFATAHVGTWNVDPWDIGYAFRKSESRVEMYLPLNEEPFPDPKGRVPASAAGIVQLPNRTLSSVSECPEEGYTHFWKFPEAGTVYCVRVRDGRHYAKLRVVEINPMDHTMTFDWAFQGNGSRQFDEA